MFRRILVSIAMMASLSASSVLAASPELIRLLDSVAGRFILTETERGAEITARSLGARLAGDDITPLLTRLDETEMREVSRRLEGGMKDIEAKFRQRFPNDGELFAARGGRALSAEQQAFLRELVLRRLRIEIRFFPESARVGYDASRQAFTRMLEFRPGGAPVKRFPFGVNPLEHPDWRLQFGFESEYTMREIEGLTSVYGPAPEFGISHGQWQNMQPSERAQWIRDNVRRLFPMERVDGGLVKIDHDPELGFLPERLIQDSTGNLEIVLGPVDTLEQWQKQVDLINGRFGAGSMQGTVSAPSDAFFGRMPGQTIDAQIGQNLGYFNFMNDLDSLSKLEVGAQRYARDPSKPAANSFKHPFLGPMTRSKNDQLATMLRENAHGRMLDPEALRQVAGSDSSFKYVGGTAYRPDIVPNARVVLEVRDAHNHTASLVDRMMRSTFYMQFGRQQFARAAEMRAFDAVADFEKFSPRVRQMLTDVFPAAAKPGVHYTPAEHRALEVYRNFAYPMRDWSGQLEFIGQRGMAARVSSAQEAYEARLEQVADELAAGAITREQASLRIQGAIAQFSPESGLTEAYRGWQARNLLSSPSYNRYLGLAMAELGPFRQAFPATIWQGSLESRMARFASRWQNNVRVIDDVRFSFEAQGVARRESSRKVLAISTNGLNAEEQRSLMADYVNAMAEGTVSFPLGENAGHLYTRMGTKVVDYYSWFNVNEYAMPSGKRLEAFVQLSPEEELRLRYYIENVVKDRAGVAGSNGYNGATQTNGTLRDNRPRVAGEGHNCTSWVCTSPIGEESRPLMSLVNAQAAGEVHTNPGWWSYYLTGAAPAERVPFVAYWTNDPVATVESTVRGGQAFPQWNFNLH